MFPFGGGNPKQMKAMLQRMGIKMEGIEASEVIIKRTNGKNLRITNPEVSKIIMQGNVLFSISGKVEEIAGQEIPVEAINPEDEKVDITDDDINLVTAQTGCNYETAKKVLEENEGDIASAILKLKK
ncbi:MAG: nascent polypeptide-associated complex protein [Candidatus Altiarchaeales archaeon HGW-Altiarchaeales-2]|nr:MAG: nascent polypeptide-associated complex protein [Candidatus Altiarchaeales archaeon HGW-Altiarchaeales-2]